MTDTKYKVGDEVRVVNLDKSSGDKRRVGTQAIVKRAHRLEGKTFYHIKFSDSCLYQVKSSEIEIIKCANSTTTMNLKEKFIGLFLSEPTKSLRKAGLINGDNIATDEGVKIYVSYLMTKDAEFKKEVVDALLKKEDKED